MTETEEKLTEEEALNLLEAAEDPMTEALVSTVWCLALRSHEVPEMEVEDVAADDAPAREATYGEFEEAIDHYLTSGHPHPGPGSRLFPSLEPGHASVEVTLTLGELATRAESVGEVTEEGMRSGALENLRSRGIDPEALREKLDL